MEKSYAECKSKDFALQSMTESTQTKNSKENNVFIGRKNSEDCNNSNLT